MTSSIVENIKTSLDASCPTITPIKSNEPWEDAELQWLISKLRKVSLKEAKKLQKQIRQKRTLLKNEFYKKKAAEINNAAEARQIEKEFQLAKSYSMHKTRSTIAISKEKLTNHFKTHFAGKDIPTPPEIENPNEYAYLKDLFVEVEEAPPNETEIAEAIKTMKNNKSAGTDKIPAEALKYQDSSSLMKYLTMLITLIWITCTVPKSWLELTITCLYKKGSKSLAENYRALSVGANISKIIPRIILNRLNNTYETNISESQFGFRKAGQLETPFLSLKISLKNTVEVWLQFL